MYLEFPCKRFLIVSFELGAPTENVTHPLETTTQAAVAKEKVVYRIGDLFLFTSLNLVYYGICSGS